MVPICRDEARKEKEELPLIVTKIFDEKLKSRENQHQGPSRKRHRPLGSPVQEERPTSTRTLTKEDRYWKSRKSIEMWPIMGEDLQQAVVSFLEDQLLMDPFQVADLTFAVKKLRGRPKVGTKDVVSVTFDTVADRDDCT